MGGFVNEIEWDETCANAKPKASSNGGGGRKDDANTQVRPPRKLMRRGSSSNLESFLHTLFDDGKLTAKKWWAIFYMWIWGDAKNIDGAEDGGERGSDGLSGLNYTPISNNKRVYRQNFFLYWTRIMLWQGVGVRNTPMTIFEQHWFKCFLMKFKKNQIPLWRGKQILITG